jgi:M6 family metalloprotease-like protein
MEIPNNLLVLRVEFSDVHFISEPQFPDYLAHDDAYFERWMLHLSDFYLDASHYQYEMELYLYPQVIRLDKSMSYYGADSSTRIDVRVAQMVQDAVNAVDADLDFTQYGGLIIFHAGAGQESDIEGKRTDQIWSTFLSRKSLQAAFDPENDDYPGLTTDDGAVLTNIVIMPEHEFQDYFPGENDEDAGVYHFSLYGVLAHQVGHILGLPTLFDNDSSNGTSQGVGNWCLMGTGVWNASGYVPAQLSAFCRLMLGWEEPVVIEDDAVDLQVDHFLDHDSQAKRLYKLPISESEYFLIENRQQNPDGSLDPYAYQPSYTFKLLPEGEQDYYEQLPLLPYFNFMKNRYVGCEWDFFLPGLGGPIAPGNTAPTDGSGLLIWHIDERIIEQNFTPNFDRNRINADSRHKGVDLEEADGIQHLDTGIVDTYKWGSPFDSYRAGNNDYFGRSPHNGYMHLPTSESYYGGIPLEVYDIGPSENTMSFSVRFAWKLTTDYEGPTPFNAAFVDLDQDGEEELFMALPDGQLYAWKDEEIMDGWPKKAKPVAQNFVWDGSHVYVPMQDADDICLYRIDSGSDSYVFSKSGTWASHPVIVDDKLYLPLNTAAGAEIVEYDKGSSTQVLYEFSEPISSNVVGFRQHLFLLTKEEEAYHNLWELDLQAKSDVKIPLDIPADSTIVAMAKAPVTTDIEQFNLIVQTDYSLYVYNEDYQLLPGFPYVHTQACTAPFTLADMDANGTLDIFLGCEDGVLLVDYSAQNIGSKILAGESSEEGGFSAGAIAVDLDGDGRKELLGNFAYNQLRVWDDNFRIKKGFPVSFADRSRTIPLLGKGSDDNYYLWSVTDNGKVFRAMIPGEPVLTGDLWLHEFGNLQRTASLEPKALPNSYASDKFFVPGEVYLFPIPVKSIYDKTLTLNVMTSQDAMLEASIYDAGGKLIYRKKNAVHAYVRNRESFSFPVERLGSGVYFMTVKAGKHAKTLKFIVEN